MVKYRKQLVEELKPKTFEEFHGIICKSIPDASRYPEMYNLCYDLMELT